MRAGPAAGVFTCWYTLALPAPNAAAWLRLHLTRALYLQWPAGGAILVGRVYYPYLGDTLAGVIARAGPAAKRWRTAVSSA